MKLIPIDVPEGKKAREDHAQIHFKAVVEAIFLERGIVCTATERLKKLRTGPDPLAQRRIDRKNERPYTLDHRLDRRELTAR